jgi:hypothetical protein
VVEMVHPDLPVHPDRQLLPQSDPLHRRNIEQHPLQPELLVEQHLVLVHCRELRSDEERCKLTSEQP